MLYCLDVHDLSQAWELMDLRWGGGVKWGSRGPGGQHGGTREMQDPAVNDE